MKTSLFTMLLLALLQISCTAQKKTSSKLENKTTTNNIISKLELTEQSRGRNILYTITPNEITTSINGNDDQQKTKPEDWALLNSILNKMDIQKINKYPAPSEKRNYDGAASSQINIGINKEIVNSNIFDAGNPPNELSELYTAIRKVLGLNIAIRPKPTRYN